MSTRTIWQLTLRNCFGVGIAVVCITTSAHAQVDPVTLAAAAGTAIEIAGKAKGFLEFIGYLPSQPDPLAGLPEKLAEIQASLDRIEQTTVEIRDIVRRLEQGAVLDANDTALNEYLDALQHVTEARIALGYLLDDPHNTQMQLETDVASRLAVQDFETRPHIFREVGPTITDRRFNHLLAYGGYLQVIAVRMAFIQAVHGPRGFTHDPYRSELQTTAQKLLDLVKKIDNALQISVNLFGDLNPLTCNGATLTLIDNILYDPVAAPRSGNTTVQTVDFPGDTCAQAAINFYLEDPIQEFRAERANQYGATELTDVADLLDNYATYGRATPPVYEFPDWIMGSMFSTANTMTFVPDGDAGPGVPVILAPAANQQAWQMPLGSGPFVHMASGLCLTASTESAALTLEVCTGTDDQLWTRTGETPWVTPLRHQASGYCLSSEDIPTRIPWSDIVDINLNVLTLGRTSSAAVSHVSREQTMLTQRMQRRVAGRSRNIVSSPVLGPLDPQWTTLLGHPRLYLATCASDRTDQVWTTTDPTTPGPVIH